MELKWNVAEKKVILIPRLGILHAAKGIFESALTTHAGLWLGRNLDRKCNLESEIK